MCRRTYCSQFSRIFKYAGCDSKTCRPYKSIKYARAYESFVAAGGILGTLAFIYRWSIRAGYWLLAAYGIFGGIFIGCMIGALAETIKSLPIFSRRLKLRSGIPYVIYGIALGKMFGCYMYFYIFR